MKIILTENKRDRLALNWLNKEFGNLTQVVRGDRTHYVDQNGLTLFYYYPNDKIKVIFIDYTRIWIFFETIFGLDYEQIQDILKIWLEETYNLSDYLPIDYGH
jgi:hypothetical protein